MFDCQDHAGGQQGFTIVEALVAFIILASGLLALLSFHGAVQRNNAEARTQAEAVALAEQKLNELASFLSADDTRLSQVSVGACPGEESTGSGVASFAFRCDMSGANPRDVRVTVSWQDRDDNPRQAVVDSKVRVSEPGRDAAGLLTLVRAAVTADEAGALWLVAEAGDGEGQDGEDGSTEESDGEESSGEEGSGSEPEHPDDPGPSQPLTLHTRTISGVTVANSEEESAPEIITVTAQSPPPSISAHCSRPTSTSFRCAVTYADPRAGWSGTIILAAGGSQRLHSGAECASTVTLSFTAVTQDISDVRLGAC